MADIVVINKADGATKAAAARAAAAFRSTVHFHRQRRQSWQPAVLMASAHTGQGVDKLQHEVGYHLWGTVAGLVSVGVTGVARLGWLRCMARSLRICGCPRLF